MTRQRDRVGVQEEKEDLLQTWISEESKLQEELKGLDP